MTAAQPPFSPTCPRSPARPAARPISSAPLKSDIDRELEAAAKLGAFHLAACEPDYRPAWPQSMRRHPCVAVRGRRDLLNRRSIALVGARDASAVGRRMARDLARDLGGAGFTIVSGMARGVDGEAHAAALETGTVAALAGGIDQIYPPQHDRLYDELSQRGCLVSESPLGYVAQARDFPKRNRVISGLSLATVIVEAAERSGSLITARFALEQGREVMAVPGSPLDPRAKGSNRLLKQGAALIESADDVLQAIEGISPPTFDEPFADRYGPHDTDVPPALLRAVREALSPTPSGRRDRARSRCAAPSCARRTRRTGTRRRSNYLRRRNGQQGCLRRAGKFLPRRGRGCRGISPN